MGGSSDHVSDGGPAFPNAINGVPVQGGMSLRDWFAGQALAGLDLEEWLDRVESDDSCGIAKAYGFIAKHARGVADAMLADRASPSGSAVMAKAFLALLAACEEYMACRRELADHLSGGGGVTDDFAREHGQRSDRCVARMDVAVAFAKSVGVSGSPPLAEVKMLEVRDAATTIAAFAVRLNPQVDGIARRGGWGGRPVIFGFADGGRIKAEYRDWDDNPRTMPEAHKALTFRWDEFEDGGVLDVQFELGETSEPKVPEIPRGRLVPGGVPRKE